NVQFSDILNRWATESGTITVTLPDGTTQQLRTAKEMDKLLDGKLNQSLAEKISGDNVTWKGIHQFQKWANISRGDYTFSIVQLDETQGGVSRLETFNAKTNERYTSGLPKKTGTLMQVGDYGIGGYGLSTYTGACSFISAQSGEVKEELGFPALGSGIQSSYSELRKAQLFVDTGGRLYNRFSMVEGIDKTGVWYLTYSTKNTTVDANGNLKAASPIVKVFADHIETNDESEGVEMEHLGVGHYLIKGVVGFNADGAWGIDNGFVIPQDHNGKNMVLIDYEVKPDGDIELFVFHQQNADLPERFQNKR
ncbi:hypothetical protein NAB32_19330, partial [Proteus mirabilis]|uniref:phage tail fiber protein n=1 Tax=Proteus mirabilis TaxID=584 RepID=UPI004032C833|nr:hypothetical protein [Proteus mirabilis]MCL8632938.1 hypothetical protein [Proteus mirabilis]